MNKDYRQILDSAASLHIPDDLDLFPRVSKLLAPRRTFVQTVRARPALAILIAFLALLLLTGVVYAITRSLGYIPGIGLVDTSSSLRVLAGPVSQTREGITITVEDVVISVDKTIIRFTVDNIPLESLRDTALCDARWGELKLPGGLSLQPVDGDFLQSWDRGYENRVVFEAVPGNVNEAIFTLPCIHSYAVGALPENWELPLHFISAPPEMTVIPVIEMTRSPEASSENPWTIEKVIETEDGYILVTKFSSISSLPDVKALHFSPGYPKITDASMREVPYIYAENKLDLPVEEAEQGVFSWAFEIEGKSFDWPLTITSESLVVEHLNVQSQFEFDTGPNPHDEQVWDVNIDLGELAAGYPVQVSQVIRRTDGYEFFFKSPQMFYGTGLQIHDTSEWITGMDYPGEFSSYIKFAGEIPAGKLTVLVTRPITDFAGLWQIQWQPENVSAVTPSAPLEAPQTCLNVDSLQVALANPAPIPTDLSGRIFLSGNYGLPADYSGEPLAYIATLDGGNLQAIGHGSPLVSPSPDGSQVVYSREDGLYIEDLATGEIRLITNTLPTDNRPYKYPYWSPDGTRIAFTRIDEPNRQPNLYTIRPDGTDLQRVTDGVEYEMLMSWFPDGSALFYVVDTQNGSSLRKLDLATGAVVEMFVADSGINVSLSPNGNDIVFGDSVNATSYGLYLSHLDGSNRRLIGLQTQDDEYHWSSTAPVWSPDGKWLIVNITNSRVALEEELLALVNPQTCQIIPLPFRGKQILAWIP